MAYQGNTLVGKAVLVALSNDFRLEGLVIDKLPMRIDQGKRSTDVTGYLVDLVDGSAATVPYFSIKKILDARHYQIALEREDSRDLKLDPKISYKVESNLQEVVDLMLSHRLSPNSEVSVTRSQALGKSIAEFFRHNSNEILQTARHALIAANRGDEANSLVENFNLNKNE